MSIVRSFAPILSVLLVGAAAAQDPRGVTPPKITPELQRALARATVHNTRVLCVFCDEGQDFAAVLKKDRTLSRKLLYEFQTVQVVGKAFGVDLVKVAASLKGRPALAVLDAEGEVLARLERDTFLTDGVLDGAALLGRLEPHFCPPVDAEAKLAAAIVEAKKTGRNVFVRFDAPW